DSQAFFRRRAQFCPPVYRCLPVCPCVPVFVCPSVLPPARPVVVTPKGRRLTVIDAGEQSPFVEVARSRITGRAKPKADFDGHDRGSAKTSIADAAVEAFPDLRALLATLPMDDAMRSLGISKEWESDRVAQEKRNVEVSAYIYAVKFEDDHDYHVIVGTDPSDADPVFFNVEI